MRYLIIGLLIASSANALTRDQGKRLMDGEDMNEVRTKTPKKVAVSECTHDGQCKFDEYCHKERKSDHKGVCVKKSKD